jgi:hypothetical protein
MKWVARTIENEVRSRKKAAWMSSNSTSLSRTGASLAKSFSRTNFEAEGRGPKGTPSIQTSSGWTIRAPHGEEPERRGQGSSDPSIQVHSHFGGVEDAPD